MSVALRVEYGQTFVIVLVSSQLLKDGSKLFKKQSICRAVFLRRWCKIKNYKSERLKAGLNQVICVFKLFEMLCRINLRKKRLLAQHSNTSITFFSGNTAKDITLGGAVTFQGLVYNTRQEPRLCKRHNINFVLDHTVI